ncbi:MAG: TonB-dependent receptor, partial [Stenotrophomonas sp.]
TSDYVTLDNPHYTRPVVFRQSASDADNTSVARNAALYVQDQIILSPQWQILAGVRYDYFDASLRNHRNGQAISSSDGLFSPRAGLIYKPQDDMSLYASYSLSYVPRAGEQLASLTPSNRTLDPEKFTNIEVGYKWDINSRLSLSSAIYQLDRTNVAITDPNNPAQSLLVDGQRVRGVELGLAGNVTDAWQIMAGYAYQDSEVQQPGAQNGNELGQVPKHAFSLWNRYDLSERWGVGLGTIYRDSVYVASDNAVVLPSLMRVDAAAFYTVSDTLRIQLNIENLFDRAYFASAHSNNNITPGSPRAFRVGIDWRF